MKLFLSFICITFLTINAQTINVKVNGLENSKAFLYSLEGEKVFFIDSIAASHNNFSFNFDADKNHKGFYRLLFPPDKWINIIYDGEEISIRTNGPKLIDSLIVLASESNRLFYSFIKLNKQFKTKTELLQLILNRYPSDDEYFDTTKKRLIELQNEYKDFVEIASQKNRGSFIARYIESAQLPIVDSNLSPDSQLKHLKAHALDNINFHDSGLIFSDVFTNKTIEYLSYYRDPQLTKESLENEFTIAVDSILQKAKVNQLVYQQIVEYLIDGFKKFGFDKIIDYVVDNYVIKDDLCLDSKIENSIQRRIEQNKKFPVNSVVPNIISSAVSGEEIDLSKINSDWILILFYSSRCPHCQTLIPKLNKLYKNQKEKTFEVLAISLDENKNDWINFVKNNELNWINVSDLKGWNSKEAIDYYIYATPTMFLIDRNKRLTGKPITINDLQLLLKLKS